MFAGKIYQRMASSCWQERYLISPDVTMYIVSKPKTTAHAWNRISSSAGYPMKQARTNMDRYIVFSVLTSTRRCVLADASEAAEVMALVSDEFTRTSGRSQRRR